MNTITKKYLLAGGAIAALSVITYYILKKNKSPLLATSSDTLSKVGSVEDDSYQQLLDAQPEGHHGGYGSSPVIPFTSAFTLADLPVYSSPNGKKIQFFIAANYYPSFITKDDVYNTIADDTVADPFSGGTTICAVIQGQNTLYPMNISTAQANGFTDDITHLLIADKSFINKFSKYGGTGQDYGLLQKEQLI